MYHAGWAWAGNTPFQYMKQVASHLGGTRNPIAVSWPARIEPGKAPRMQFTHVTDIAPTIYDALGIPHPRVVDGHEQIPMDGLSFFQSFGDPDAPSKKKTQYFEMFGNMGIYDDGWLASSLGPTQNAQLRKQGGNWDPEQNKWQLYNLETDFTQSEDVSAQHPERTQRMSDLFMSEARANSVFPIGGSIWVQLHPEDRVATPYTEWEFDQSTRRMPEFTAPGLGRASNTVEIDAEVTDGATGVLYALGGFSGGLVAFMDEGRIGFEYNTMMIERSNALSDKKVKAGQRKIEVNTEMDKPSGPARITILVDGEEYASLQVERTVPLAFTASETFDVGIDLRSPVSHIYYDRRPFAFDGTINTVRVSMVE